MTSLGDMVAQANRIKSEVQRNRNYARLLERKAGSIARRSRSSRNTNRNMQFYLMGLATILRKVSSLDSGNPWYKSAGNGKKVGTVATYVLRCKQLRRLKYSELKDVINKWITIEPDVAARFIPKVGEQSGLRPLGVPGHMSKALETILTPFVDSVMQDKVNDIHYFGYKKGHSCHKAQKCVKDLWSSGKYKYAIMLDQSGAFNSLTPHAKQLAYAKLPYAIRKMAEQFTERPTFTELEKAEWKYNKQGQCVVWYTGSKSQGFSTHFIKKYKDGKPVVETIKGLHGTPQGGVLSPRIFMIAQSIAYAEVQGIAGVVYADDAVIFTNRNPEDVKSELTEAFAKLGLRVNADKSFTSKETAQLLGWITYKDGYVEVDSKHFKSRAGLNKDGNRGTSQPEFRAWDRDMKRLVNIETYVSLYHSKGRDAAIAYFSNKEFNQYEWGSFNYYCKGVDSKLKAKEFNVTELDFSEKDLNPLLQIVLEHPFIRRLTKADKLMGNNNNDANSSNQLESRTIVSDKVVEHWMVI